MNLSTTLFPVRHDGQIAVELAILLELFGISPRQSLESLDEELWSRWVSKNDKRRKSPEADLSSRYDKAIFWRSIRGLGFYDELMADHVRYDHVLVRGGPLTSQDRKNELLVRLWKQGVDFGTITHMGGGRKLNSTLDSSRLLHHQQPGGLAVDPNWRGIGGTLMTEADILIELWQRSLVPPDMCRIPTQFIGDTYAEWFETDPRPGRHVLIVETNPQAAAQYWDAIDAFHGTCFDVHVAAPSAALGSQQMSCYTSAIARWIRSYRRATSEV